MLLSKINYLVDLFFIPLSLIVFIGVGQAINYLEEKQHRLYLTTAFGKYINKHLLKQIIEHKQELKLGGGKRTISIFFSDIRGFTSLSEKLSPEELVNLINRYLTEMTRIILKYDGTVDKFIGDAIMAFWNAPLLQENHAELDCECAIEQIKALKKLQEELVKEGLPKIEIGCGIHTGEAVIGNMGSDERFDYTAIGDSVNLCSRLEGLTKEYGVNIIISEDTYKIIKNKFNCRKLDVVKVKGKKIPVVIYELCIDYNKEFCKLYEEALELYFKGNFRKALSIFREALKKKQGDKSCDLFIKRCEEYIKNPPSEDWDGSFEMKTK